jgi:hypothetical protein
VRPRHRHWRMNIVPVPEFNVDTLLPCYTMRLNEGRRERIRWRDSPRSFGPLPAG